METPIILIIIFAFVIVLAIIKAITRHQDRNLAHKERLAAIEKGLPIPQVPASITKMCDCSSRQRNMRTGLILVFVGIGILVSFIVCAYVVNEGEVIAGGAFGLIPFFIGVGHFIYALTLPKDKQRAEAAQETENK